VTLADRRGILHAMPIYDYRCTDCDERYDKLVRRAEDVVTCPSCGSEHSERLLSVFAGIGSGGKPASTPNYSRVASMPRGGGGCSCGHAH
jgi:putative FmdB family regulatory protein